MPAKSAKQYGLMAAAMTGHVAGIPKSIGKEFVEKTPAAKRKRFAKELTKKTKKIGMKKMRKEKEESY